MTERVKRALLSMQRRDWEHGVAAQAFLEAGDKDIAIAMAVEGANRQQPNGRCCQVDASNGVTDPCAIGEALIFACEQTGDPFLCAARDKLLHWALVDAPRTDKGIVHHFSHDALIWVDCMYMLPPFLARAGYFDEAMKQLDGCWDILLDPEKNLLSHQWSEREKVFHRKDVWAVGNGWAMAGMARVIALLPESHAEAKARLISRVKLMIDAALPFMMEDGSFHDVLDDPTTFREVNFSQMLAYTIYRGIDAGWLEDSYLPAAEKARAAALNEVDGYGLVRNVCGMPHFDHPGVAAEGQAFHILMEAARADLMHQ